MFQHQSGLSIVLFLVWHQLTLLQNLLVDKLLNLHQDQKGARIQTTTGRRTRSVKIDFTNKKLPGEQDGEGDENADEEEEHGAEKEPVVEGKGKRRAVEKPSSSSRTGARSGSKPASKA
jgi:hypothetical protein